MAVNAVQQLITRNKEISFELRQLEEELKRLKNEHRSFWEQYENQCAKTFHDLTPEQTKKYKAGKVSRTPTMLDVRMMFGYKCPYCREWISRHRRWDDCHSWDGYVKTSFNSWLNKDISNWPEDKQALYIKAKKEVEDYFSKAEPLEQRIERLSQEEKQILQDLDTIWNICDLALGKSRQYEATIAELNYRLAPYDRDKYYND